MKTPSALISLDLLANAADSLGYAIELLAWKDIARDERRMKQAVLATAQGIELLLKERLRRIQPALVWEDVDKYPSLDARTVTTDRAVSRLRTIGGVEITDDDVALLKSLRRTRNAIEHFEWHTSIAEVKSVVGPALSFGLAFAEKELGRDLGYEFRRDDTWDQLLQELQEFASSHAERVTALAGAADEELMYCDHCGQWAVPKADSSCLLCGHWSSLGSEPE